MTDDMKSNEINGIKNTWNVMKRMDELMNGWNEMSWHMKWNEM